VVILCTTIFLIWHNSPSSPSQWARAFSFLRLTQLRTIVGRAPLDEWSARRRDLNLTTHNIRNKHPCPRWHSNPQLSRRAALDRAATGIGTASLTFTNSTFCPHSVFMCFVWIWEQTAIISLYSINWLVFIAETESVYCAVRTGYLDVIQTIGYYMYHQFNIHKFHVLPTQCIYMFCVDLRTNSDYFPIQH